MKGIKLILIIMIFQFSFISYSQNIIRYESDYAISGTIDKDESPDGGSIEDIIKSNVMIIYDTNKSTIEIKLSDYDKRIYFFTNVIYNQTFTNNGNKYVSYTAYKDDVPYFISFGKDLIKVDNRVKYKSIAFHLKK